MILTRPEMNHIGRWRRRRRDIPAAGLVVDSNVEEDAWMDHGRRRRSRRHDRLGLESVAEGSGKGAR